MSDSEPQIAVLVDDELHNMMWMADWLESIGLDVQFARDAGEAINVIDQDNYRILIVDLNIPVIEPYANSVAALGPTYIKYPGLYVARHARSRGYRNRQVILYTVHKDRAVSAEADRLGCTYILKGRPREIKQEIQSVLNFQPGSAPQK
jgi:CheY-like chemotaxis protein